jgi:glycine/D-amino acid oxidase-like deaminating enzyme
VGRRGGGDAGRRASSHAPSAADERERSDGAVSAAPGAARRQAIDDEAGDERQRPDRRRLARLARRRRPARLARRSIEGNLAVACRVVPQVASLHLLRVWTALITRVPDGNPVLGETPGVPGFFQAVAIPNGYTLGPLCARLVAEAVCGRQTSFDLSPWSPARFAGTSCFH